MLLRSGCSQHYLFVSFSFIPAYRISSTYTQLDPYYSLLVISRRVIAMDFSNHLIFLIGAKDTTLFHAYIFVRGYLSVKMEQVIRYWLVWLSAVTFPSLSHWISLRSTVLINNQSSYFSPPCYGCNFLKTCRISHHFQSCNFYLQSLPFSPLFLSSILFN